MRTAEQWTALYEDAGSPLNDPPRHITDIIRKIQREAFDAGACSALAALPSWAVTTASEKLASGGYKKLKERP